MVWYFAYGSNMLRARLERRVGPVRDEGCLALLDYRHAFRKRGGDGTAKGAILQDTGKRVYGVLYELSATQLEALVPYERDYRQIEVTVGSGRATTFEPTPDVLVEGLAPSPAYARLYLEGMAEHGFPASYVQEIVDQLRAAGLP